MIDHNFEVVNKDQSNLAKGGIAAASLYSPVAA